MNFSEEVKYARTQLNLTQMAFAKELNISFSTLNRWEKGRTEPHLAIKGIFYSYCKAKKIRRNS